MTAFVQYSSSSAYTTARDQLTAQFENNPLYNNSSGAGLFYYDSAGLNIGFGYNLTGHIGTTSTSASNTRAALADIGFTFTDTQWNAVVAAARVSPSSYTSSSASTLNSALGGVAITQSQAYTLMDAVYDDFESDLDDTLSHYGITPDSTFADSYVRVGLADEFYNTDRGVIPVSAFGPKSAYDFRMGDIGGLAYQTAFLLNKTGDDGLAARRMAEAYDELGGVVSLSGSSIDSVDFSNASSSALAGFAQAVYINSSSANAYLDAHTLADDNYISGVSSLISAVDVAGTGYYVDKTGDTLSSVATFEGVTGFDSDALKRLNALFPNTALQSDDSLDVGGILYVPISSGTSVSGTPSGLGTPGSNQSFVYDPNIGTNGTVFTIGAPPDGGDTGAFHIEASSTGSASGDQVAMGNGTYGDVSASGGTVTVVIKDPFTGSTIGSLSFDTSNGNATLTDNDSNTESLSGPDPIYIVPDVDGGIDIFQQNGSGITAFHINASGVFSDFTKFPDGGALLDGLPALTMKSLFNKSEHTDPIVLDLSSGGTGVELTPLVGSSAYFDLYNTGFAVHTGWVGPTTGILVNTTDPTNITDMFGNSSVDGFSALKALDSNNDGVINSSDSGYSNLYVWEDANGDGTVDSGEVQSLSSLGITSISLNTSEVNEDVNGNIIGSVATFTNGSTTTGEVAEAFFDNSSMDSTYTGSYTLNPEVLSLPNVRGYGTLPDLYVAMSQDPTLLGQVQNLTTDSLADAATFDEQVKNIIYRWAGVDAVDPTSRGDYVNARDLEVLEQFLGQSFLNAEESGVTQPVTWQGGHVAETAWETLFTGVKERLLAQGPLASLLSGVTYNYDTDSFTGTADLSTLVTAIGDNIPSDPIGATQYLASMGQFVDQLASDLGISTSTYNTALQTLFADNGMPLSITAVDDLHYVGPGYSKDVTGDVSYDVDTSGAIIIGEPDVTNILDTANNANLSDTVISDVQTLSANSLTLTALQFSGFENIDNSSGTFSYDVGQLNAATAGTYDLSSKTISGYFNMAVANNNGTTLIGDNENGQELFASASGNDTLEAGGGTGDQLLAGGGVDTLIGGSGSTTFYLQDGVVSGTSLVGGSGSNTLSTSGTNITSLSISGIQTLSTNVITLSASEFSNFSNINNSFGTASWWVGAITASSGGTYDLSGKTVSGYFNMYAGNNSGTTLIGDNDNNQQLYASTSGNDTLEAGAGSGVQLFAGGGVDTLIGGSGSTTFYLQNGAVSGTTLEGGTGSNTLNTSGTNLSGLTISGIQTLATNVITLSASQFSGFSNINNSFGTASWWVGTITAGTAGTYDLTSKTVSGYFNMYAGNNGGTTLIGDSDNNQQLYASTSGNDTLEAGSGTGVQLYAGGGVDTLIGGSGSTTFYLQNGGVSGTTLEGGTGSNTLSTSGTNISGLILSGIQTLSTNVLTLSASEFAGFDNINNSFGTASWQVGAITAGTAGTYDISSKTVSGYFNMYVGNNSGTTLIGDNDNGQQLYASSSGADTLEAGNGSGVQLYAGGGVDTLIGGSGSTTFYLQNGVVSGTTLEGGTGSNTLSTTSTDISSLSISGIQTLSTNNITLSASQFAGFDNITNSMGPWSYDVGAIFASTGGTYDLSSETVSGYFNMYANSNSGTTLIGDNEANQQLYASASGNDTLQEGSGSGDYLAGGGGYDTYKFGSSFGQDTINNVYSGSRTTASGEVDFLGGTTDQNLWFQQSGNDLQVDLLGTSDQITIQNFFGSNAGAQVQKFTADGLTLDSQISTLVSAMATYASNNSGFNPATASSMPTDTTLQSAIASAWHT